MPTLRDAILRGFTAPPSSRPVVADPAKKLVDDYTNATQPIEALQRTRDYGTTLNTLIDLLTPSRADLATLGATKAVGLAGKALTAGTKGVKAAVLGGKKMAAAVPIITSRMRDVRKAAKKIVQPDELLDAALIPVLGDATRGGELIERVGDIPVEVATHAGPDYSRIMRPHGIAWATSPGRATRLANRTQVASGLSPSGRVIGVYTNQGPDSLRFSTDTSELALQMLERDTPHRADIRAFNDVIRQRYPDFVGIRDPNVRTQLFQNNLGGTRSAILKEMGKAEWRKLGFPDMATVRQAVTEPELLDAPSYSGGFSLMELTPGDVLQNVGRPHPSYSHQLRGKYLGRLPNLVPLQDMFRQSWGTPYNLIGSQGKLSGGARWKLERSLPIEVVDQAAVDALEASLRAAKKK